MAKILIVEDEPAIAELVALNLRHDGHDVEAVADADAAVERVRAALPDLVVLDWMLPGESGLSLARRWRAEPRTRELPIVMLTARAEERDLVQGLDAGADDYIGKPFSAAELLARIRSLLRRKAPEALDVAVQVGRLRLDPGTMRVFADATQVHLGPTEFRLLRFLMTYPERVHSRAQLLDRVWGDHVFIEERTVDVHVKRLRDSLQASGCATMIETVRGAGYRLARPAPVSA
ncbi:MAG: phosphate regulon transcriptional regulator PhoB [Burkholderiales bacterium]|nr:phosphate regulon transcriptional regulator PhoB [Burkholderiales bacterium]MDE2564557.1 phosphate regulon transcriptional regulator PhoB [Burkholderiales bacterium]